MENYQLAIDEVILYDGETTSSNYKGRLKVTLTSQRIIIEKENMFTKKATELLDEIPISTIKVYNEAPQVKRKGHEVDIQTESKNLKIEFFSSIESGKFENKIVDLMTGTTAGVRTSNKVKGALDVVDDTLGLNTRETVKGILENGVKGTLINGIKHKK
ncbi:MAG: hypothetical protein LUH56_02540 [Oscillospiraceae bacterium]|nr:hypothetical protein [Oscillospiraceae bacterium]